MAHNANPPRYGFLIDVSKCIDCRTCMVACSVENAVPMDSTRIWIEETGITGEFPNLSRFTTPFHCMHCIDPSCVSACTVAALHRNEDGIVIYDENACIGCRYCMYACPFNVPKYEWKAALPLVVKCDMCAERLAEGQQPACAQTCPTGAIEFGRYNDMLAKAYQMISDHPGKYVSHVYGEHENGGTATLYISPVPFEELGFPATMSTSTAFANRLVTEGTPLVAGMMLVGLSGAYLTIKRLKEEAKADGHGDDDSHAEPEDEEQAS